MVGGARESGNGTAPSLLVASSTLMVETMGRGGRELSVSGYGSSEFLESLTGPSPTLVLPNNTGESIGARGVFPGPKASAHTLVPREGGYSGPWETLSSQDPGLAPTPVCLSDWGDPSELVTPPALPPSDRCLRQASQGLGQWQRGLHTAE